MAVTNTNLKMIDRPIWEQLSTAPAPTAAAVAVVDDNYRFIYVLYSATAFWRYDTWADTWQQLANHPGGTLAAGSCLRYIQEMGSQINGEVFGSVYAFISSGSSVVFYRYDIGTNTWTTALSVANIPTTWGTDGRLVCPEPMLNNYEGAYHVGVGLNTITASSTAAIGATSISVSALPLALPIGAVLNFGTSAAPVWVVTTAAAAANATSITVSALIAAVPSGATAYWYADMFLVGNNAAVMYRYNIAANTWALTSANAGTPTLASVPATVGAGCIMCWLPGSGATNANVSLLLVRGGASSSIYEYNLATNTFSTLTFYPNTETFGAGTSSGIIQSGGKNKKLIIQKDVTSRVYEFDRARLRIEPKCTQSLIAQGTAVVGDKSSILIDPSGTVQFLYSLINTSNYFVRTPLVYL